MFCKTAKITDRSVIDKYKSIQEIVEYIKSDQRDEISNIESARRNKDDQEKYKQIKINGIPAVSINFQFENDYINGENASTATGYMYFDIDDQDTLGDIDYDYITAYWKSLSEDGYSLIVKVDHLNKEYLRQSYTQVASILDIQYDPQAVSVDRMVVLSYDHDAYYNPDAISINLDDFNKTLENGNLNNFQYNNLEPYNSEGKIRFSNYDEIISKLNIEYDKDGCYDFGSDNKIKFANCYSPHKKINQGSRNRVLSALTYQLVALNKNINKLDLSKIVRSINIKKMNPPLEDNEVESIISHCYNNRKNLKPKLNKTKRFIYDKDLYLSPKEKRSLACKRISADKVKKSKEKIRKTLINWNYDVLGKITQKKVAEISHLNIKTVRKYYTDLIKELGIEKKKGKKSA